MATYGRIDEYDESEEWTQYVERMDHYFEANDIEDKDKKRSIFLSVIGAKTYKLMRGLIRPEVPNKLSYEELSEAIKNHYVPKPSVIVQRYKFNTRVRRNDESISTFMAELRALSEHCEFGSALDEMLRDRLVCGVNEDRIQRRLLAEPTLDLKRALEIAHGMETAAKDVRDLKGEMQNNPMNKLHGGRHSDEYKECYRCGGKHDHTKCRFKTEKCHQCGKIGHIAKVCRSAKKVSSEKRLKQGKNFRGKKGRDSEMNKVEQQQSDEELAYNLFSFKDKDRTPPYREKMTVNGIDINMEIDTGASFSVINEKTLQEISRGKGNLDLKQTEISLRTYTGEKISPKGITEVVVEYNNQVSRLPLLVLKGNGPNLIGRNWLENICLNWTSIKRLAKPNLEEVLNKYDDLFTDELGKLNGVTAKIYVDPSTKPIFCKARSVPYTMKPKIEKELERLERQGTIETVQYSDWATPVVPIIKPDGSVRLCGDYKRTVNKVSRLDAYPLPKIEEVHNKLAGGKTFTELDLSHAYEQMVLDDASKDVVTINTHRGLYRYNRLPYGVSSAPGIFQRTMESLLNGIPYTGILLDNILISGPTDEEHLQNLEEVMKRLSEAGLRLKKSKCRFMQPTLECLGYRIDETGIYPVEAKVKAVQEAPTPTNVTELKAYLGLLNFYGKFLPNLSAELEPLYQLLRKNQRWKWNTEQIRAFERSKTLLQSATVLVHYDQNKKLTVSCDASPYGVGAVLSHEMPDGSERPIAFASRTLTSAEKKYSQLDKEGLAMVFAVKKFHQFLYGRHFTIYTDHKPLLGIFKCEKPVPLMASGRIQRWALTLAAYEYDLIYRPGKENGNADALSRLPLKIEPKSTPIPQEVVNLVDHLNQSPVDALKIKQWTLRDPVLSRVLKFTLQGWPAQVNDENIKPYLTRKDEISVQDGCLLWGSRVVVPPKGRTDVLNLLHDTHPGMSRMKSLARGHVWWPGIDKEIEEKAKKCSTCQVHQRTPQRVPLHPWEWPHRPWSRIHIDYAGPFMGKMFLLIIDAHSKWLDIHITNSCNTQSTVEKLRMTFANHGLPEMVVSDNGPAFVSKEFEEFMKNNGIRHVKSAPYHPSTNGLVERAVQTFKKAMKKQSGTLQTRLSRFLFKYRTTPHTTTGISPAELRWGTKLRSHLTLLQPDVGKTVRYAQHKQKRHCDL